MSEKLGRDGQLALAISDEFDRLDVNFDLRMKALIRLIAAMSSDFSDEEFKILMNMQTDLRLASKNIYEREILPEVSEEED